MTDLRSPEEVFDEAYDAWFHHDTRQAAAAIIRADREQVERDTIRRVVEWLEREEENYSGGEYSGFVAMIREELEAGEWKQ